MAETIEETKVYYQEEIPDVELPEMVSYAQVIDAPQSVSDLNTVDGQKLEAIEYNDGDPYWINDIINARIDTAQKNILADWNFGDTDYAGGVYAGDISWNSSTGAVTGGSGVVLNRNGLIGANGGSVTFSIDATTGDATFSGDITASTITGGSISGATITGGTIRTASSGERVQMLSSTNTLQILDSSGVVRAESFENGFEFNNSAGNTRGRVFIENTFGNLQIQAVSADLFLTAVSDITFAPGNGSISMYIDATSKDLVLNSGDLVLGSTTIAGGGSWTLTLPPNDGTSGQFLRTDGNGNATWATVSAGANTSLSNLSSVAINTSLISDTASTDNLGSSSIPWNNLYIDDIYLTNGGGTIKYSGNTALDFYASHIRLGSSYDDFSPASALGGNLGDTFRWNAFFVDSIDANAIDTTDIDVGGDLTFSTGEYLTASASDIQYHADSDHIFYIGGTLQAIIDDNIYTEGDLLAGGSKPFLIPHPDGSDRLLRYTAQESPEVILRHRGIATTDRQGKAEITFPEHFKLVTDKRGEVTVNLTAVGNHIVYLAGKPTNAEMIVGSEPGVTFHYEVMAVRDGFLGQAVEIEEGDQEGLHAKMKRRAARNTEAAKLKQKIEKRLQGKVAVKESKDNKAEPEVKEISTKASEKSTTE